MIYFYNKVFALKDNLNKCNKKLIVLEKNSENKQFEIQDDVIKRQKDVAISNLQNSKSFKLGDLFFCSIKKP